jgi:hypothetical protein
MKVWRRGFTRTRHEQAAPPARCLCIDKIDAQRTGTISAVLPLLGQEVRVPMRRGVVKKGLAHVKNAVQRRNRCES